MPFVPDFPWGRLELDPATATERDVKRAYARLIKVHRPDTDPQGFRDVHEAYQAALTWLREAAEDEDTAEGNAFYPLLETKSPVPATVTTEDPAAAEGPPDPPLVVLDSPNSLESEFSPALKLFVEAFLAALSLRSHRRVHQAYQAIERHLQEHPAEVALLDATFYQQLRQTTGALAKFLTPQRLLPLVQREAFYTAELMLQRWHLTRRGAELRTFLKLFLRQPTTVEHRASLDFQLKLAEMAVFIDCDRAEQLTNRIFPHLSPAQRKYQLATFEARAAVAKIFAVLPLRDRLFWESKIYPLDREEPLFDRRETRRFYRNATTICPASWPGWDLLEEVVPQWVLQPRRWRILMEVNRPRFCGFKQSDWRPIPLAPRLQGVAGELWQSVRRFLQHVTLTCGVLLGLLVVFFLFMALVLKCAGDRPGNKTGESSKRIPLPPELESLKGEYQLDQLLAVRARLAHDLEALPGYDQWKRLRFAGEAPPGARTLMGQKVQVETLIDKARAKTVTPWPLPPQ